MALVLGLYVSLICKFHKLRTLLINYFTWTSVFWKSAKCAKVQACENKGSQIFQDMNFVSPESVRLFLNIFGIGTSHTPYMYRYRNGWASSLAR